MHSGNLNNTRYNDLGKLMKHSFQGKKNLGTMILREQSTISN